MTTEASKPWWHTNGLLKAGGWHPYTGRMRRGIQPEDAEEQYEWEYTEEHILRLKELGVRLLVGQFDRGLGETDQAPHQDKAKLQAELCHKHGIYHGVYMANTVYFESMLKDHPDCEDWVVHTHDGRLSHYGGLQTFRWVACFNSPGWRQHMKEQVQKAIEYVGTDLLHWDNLGVWPEPDSCHCQHCQAAFRRYLQQRYPTAEEQTRRFGFAAGDFSTFRAPNYYLRFIQPWEVDHYDNPLHQDWIEFRMWTVTDYIRDMMEYARSLKPDIGADSNGQSIFGMNQAFIHGIDQDEQARHVDIICDECPDTRPDDEPGAIYPATVRFRGLKFHRRYGRPIFTAFNGEERLAFNMTFGGHPGINNRWGYAEPGKAPLRPPQPGVWELLEHYRRHENLYLDAVPLGRIAVWRGKKSLAFCSTDTHLSACVIEQLLFNTRIPFHILMDRAIAEEDLSAWRLIVVPNTWYISDEQVERLSAYVRGGGALLLTEQAGQFTAQPRRRTRPAFAHLFAEGLAEARAEQVEAFQFDPNKQFATKVGAGAAAYAVCGAGRVAYLPRIDYVHRPHAFRSGYNKRYDGIDSRYWKEPHNRREILDAIRWLDPSWDDVRVTGGPELRIELVRTAGGTHALHLLRCGELDGPRDLMLSLRTGAAPAGAVLCRPDRAEPIALQWHARGDRQEAALGGVGRHAVVNLGDYAFA